MVIPSRVANALVRKDGAPISSEAERLALFKEVLEAPLAAATVLESTHELDGASLAVALQAEFQSRRVDAPPPTPAELLNFGKTLARQSEVAVRLERAVTAHSKDVSPQTTSRTPAQQMSVREPPQQLCNNVTF